jgi:hypothetical protein
MIMVVVPMAPPGLALPVVAPGAAFAVMSVVVVPIVVAPGSRRWLSGRLRDDRRRWRRGRNGPGPLRR